MEAICLVVTRDRGNRDCSRVFSSFTEREDVFEDCSPRRALAQFLMSIERKNVISIYETQASDNSQKQLVCWLEI